MMSGDLTPLEAACLKVEPFADGKDDDEPQVRTVKIVTTRKPHECLMTFHEIPVGSRARCEKSVFDGKWARGYCCMDCLKKEYETLFGVDWWKREGK